MEVVAFSHDGRTVGSGSYYPESAVRLWDATDGAPLATLPGHNYGVLSVDFSPDGRHLAAGQSVGGYPPGASVKLWDILDEVVVDDLGGCFVAFSPSGELLASGGIGVNRSLYMYRVSDGERLYYVYTGTYVTDIAYSPTGELVATSGTDNDVKLWDAEAGDLVRTLVGHTDDVSCVAFSPEEAYWLREPAASTTSTRPPSDCGESRTAS